MRRSGPGSEDSVRRGQSEVLGLTLLFGITILGVTAIVAFGSAAVDDTRHTVRVDSAVDGMSQLDSRASRVALGWSDVQRVDLGRLSESERVYVAEGAGWMNISVYNATTDDLKYVIMNRTLGAVVYEVGETTVAYQGGGVWRGTDQGSVMVSPPEVHYRGSTLTLPLVTVNDGGSVGSTIVVRKGGPTVAQYPDDTLHNPIDEGLVNVTVHSRYYEAWGAFFEQRTDGRVSYDHANRTVTLTLVVSGSVTKVSAGIVSGASGYSLNFGNGGLVDSYNSSVGPYSETQSTNGTIVTAGGVILENDATIRGTVNSGGGKVALKQPQTLVTGDIHYTTLGEMKGTVEGQLYPNGSAPDLQPVGTLVENRVEDVRSNNDNGNETAIESNELADQNGWEIGAASGSQQYYLERMTIRGETLTINATNGNVILAVAGDIALENGAKIEVVGGGTVRVYMNADKFAMTQGSIVNNTGMDSPQFWLYAPPELKAEFGNDVTFVGVVYAPATGNTGYITLEQKAEVYGGLVGRVTRVGQSAEIHFDETLIDASPLPEYATLPKVAYMHISTNPINVTGT